MTDWISGALSVGTGLAAGALVGVERGWKLKSAKPGTRVAGVRTFSMLGLTGGIAGLLGALGQPLAAGALAAAAATLMVIAYSSELREQQDSTTAVAALAVIAIAFLAGIGWAGMAIACATVVVALLALRDELHGFIDRLEAADVKALARFALIAGAVLPFLPNGNYGPYGAWNPQKLWMVVVLVTGFSFLGYIANRLFGERRGTIAMALIGGAYSSTAVTQSLAQRLGSAERPGAEPAGIALASAVMYLRVILLVSILATRVLVPFTQLLIPALLVEAAGGYWLYRTAPKQAAPAAPGNPIDILPALAFVAFLAAAGVAARWAEGRFGEEGIAVLILITGSMDVDTAIVTLGGLAPSTIGANLAALALAGAVLANMAVKLGITLSFARGKGMGAALVLGASMAALAVTMVVGWTRL